MKKHIIMTRILEFGGSNTYLNTLIRYFGEENLILILQKKYEQSFISKIDPGRKLEVIILPDLKDNVHFRTNAFYHNLKEIYYLICVFCRIFLLSAKYGSDSLTISSIDPEKYLYFFWIPFIKVRYVLHTKPLSSSTKFTRLTCNLMLSKHKQIITVSEANKKCILVEWRIIERKKAFVNVVYNCANNKRKNNKTYSVNDKMQIVLTMGHVVEYKNPELWLEVAKRVTEMNKNVLFYWLGNGRLLTQYQKAVQQSENIHFVGLIENPELYLSSAALYYQPSLIETQGIAVIDAMSCKVACVVSDSGGLPESVENNISGYVVKVKDADEHVDKIINLLDNEELRKSFGENGYRRYLNHFDFESFKRQMDKIY